MKLCKPIGGIALVLILLLGLFACSGETADGDAVSPSDSQPTVSGEGGEEMPLSSYDALGISADTVLLTVNGEEITAQEFFYWLDSSYDYMVYNYGSVTDWDTMATQELTIREYLLADALESVKFYHLFTTAGAGYGGAEVTEEDQIEIDANYAMYINQYYGSEEAFETALSEMYFISRDIFVYTHCVVPVLYNKIFYNMFGTDGYLETAGVDEIEAYVNENIIGQNYIRAAHILFKTTDENGSPLTDEQIAEKEQLATQVLGRLQAGEDFFALMEEYSDDTGKAAYPDGYYFNESSGFVEEFYAAALSLGENEMSGIVESELGYHIILRLPIEPEDFAEEVCWNQYEDILTAWREEAVIEFSELFESIDPALIYPINEAAK